jgi:hypothetical protein
VAIGDALGAISLGEVAARIGEGVGWVAPASAAANEDVDFF